MTKRFVTSRQDRVAWLVLLLGLALLLLPRRLRLAVSQPIQSAVLAPLRLSAACRRALRDPSSENERLSLLAARLAVENARLTSLQSNPEPAPGLGVELVRSPVVSRDLGTFEQWLVISRGSRHGVSPGAPVITATGVCGKVIACGPNQSLVQSILSPEFRAAVLDLRSRVPAVARVDRSGGLVLEYAPKESDFRVGDTLVTAGLGTVFPKGLRFGEVVAVPDRPEALFKAVSVRPFVDVSRVEEVFVMRLSDTSAGPGWLENVARPEVSIPGEPSSP